MRKMCYNAQHISEFDGGYNGTCTQTSAAVCVASGLGTPTDHDGMVNLMLEMTKHMIAENTAGANGATTVYNVAQEIRFRGAEVLTEWVYQQPLQSDWKTLLAQEAGNNPVLLQVATAYGAYDVNGTHYNQGVDYHAIAIVGYDDSVQAFVVADPNAPQAEQDYVLYPLGALEAMTPCGLICVKAHNPIPAPEPILPPSESVTGTDFKLPAQYVVVEGDTLYGITERFHLPYSWMHVYTANQSTIESEARMHGLASSNTGWLIFPGTVLTLPSA